MREPDSTLLALALAPWLRAYSLQQAPTTSRGEAAAALAALPRRTDA
jgi:hypothetical protein